jgi:hypothetical protein
MASGVRRFILHTLQMEVMFGRFYEKVVLRHIKCACCLYFREHKFRLGSRLFARPR